MSLYSIAQAETWNRPEFQRKSLQLSQFLRGDFSSIARELARVFPNTEGLQERFVPLVQRFAHELSGLYSRPVVRTFSSPTASPEALAKLADLYLWSGVDRKLQDVHRMLLVQQTVVLLVLPDRLGRVRLQAFEPWQVEWTSGDPMRADDLSRATEVRLRVPVSVTATTIVYGDLVLTPTEAYIQKGGAKVPVYGNSTSNPFGRIPLVVLRSETPPPGRWAAAVNEPLLTMQLALCIAESDTELLVHTQAWGQKVIRNAQYGQQVETLQVGPDKVLALVNNDPTAPPPELGIVQGQPPLSQITGWNESRLRLLCSMFDLSPDAFLKVNTAVTASARAYDARDREEAKARFLPVFADGERELAREVAAVSNLTEPLQIPEDVSVAVQYTEADMLPADPLAESQALASDLALGIRSRVEFVARRDGLTWAQAVARIQRNLADEASFRPVVGPVGTEGAPPGGFA